MTTTTKPILCLDFDGVIHSYTSGWKATDQIPDPPVPGAFKFMLKALDHFDVQIFSSRSAMKVGIQAMGDYIRHWAFDQLTYDDAKRVMGAVSFPTVKPPAFLTIDDRAMLFTGVWPEINGLKSFKPWNKP